MAAAEPSAETLRNLIVSGDIAVLLLDRAMQVRWFSPATAALFGLGAADVGGPVGSVAEKVGDAGFAAEAGKVLETLAPREAELRAPDGRWYLRRIAASRDGDGRIDGVVATFTDITRRRAEEDHQRLLVSELRHRIRNLLASLRSIARETMDTLRHRNAEAEFPMAFGTRLEALARVHALVMESPAERVALEELLRQELIVYVAREDENFRLSGPEVRLHPRAAQMIGLAFNELATNALKHGALADDHGCIEVTWRLAGAGPRRRLVIVWAEHGVPAVDTAPDPGFGAGLIETALPYTLGGTAVLAFVQGGVRCTIDIPVRGNLAGRSGGEGDDGAA